MTLRVHCGWVGVIVLVCLGTGCNTGNALFQPGGTKAKQKPTAPAPPKEANIIGVHVMRVDEPWIGFNRDGVMRIGGVRLTLVLEAGNSSQGVYGDGTIEATVYRVLRSPDRTVKRAVVKKWEYSSDDALGLLGRQQKAVGWWYGLRLIWGDVNLAGSELQVVVRFIRRDGQVVEARPIALRVPA